MTVSRRHPALRHVVGVAVTAALLAGVTAPLTTSSAAAAPAVTADDGAKVVAQKWIDARTLDITIASPAVGADVPVRLLMPKGWTPETTRTWPLVMLLQGAVDYYTSWTRETDVAKRTVDVPVIVAMPSAGLGAAYTDYFKPPATGGPAKWETFHTVELLQILERQFHSSTKRAVAGISFGGLGAMSYAGRHPELFRYAASYSGPVAIRQPGAPLILIPAFGDPDPFSRYGVPGLDDANWKAHDPVALAARYKGIGLYLSSGTTGLPAPDDTVPWGGVQLIEPAIAAMNAAFISELDKNKIPVTKHFYTLGEHQWVSWQREFAASWPLMLKAIGV